MDKDSGESSQEEVAGAGEGESEIEKPVRGCRIETELIPETRWSIYRKERSVIRIEDDVGRRAINQQRVSVVGLFAYSHNSNIIW